MATEPKIDPKTIDMPLPGGGSMIQHSDAQRLAIPTQTESMALTSMLERLMRDPSIDVGKIKEMVAILNAERDRQARIAFGVAMAECQALMQPIGTDAASDKAKYATYEKLDKVMRPIYTRHGFSLSYDSGERTKLDLVPIFCTVRHVQGHEHTYRLDVPADGKGAKGGDVMTATHAVGSATTYGERYLIKMIFNVVISKDIFDDDGLAAGEVGDPLMPEQIEAIKSLLKETDTDQATWLGWLSKRIRCAPITDIDHIPMRGANEAIISLRKKRDAMKQAAKAATKEKTT